MKCFIFIFTLYSVGTFIDGHVESDTEASQSEYDIPPSDLRPEDNQPEEILVEGDAGWGPNDDSLDYDNNHSETSSLEDDPSGKDQVIFIDENSRGKHKSKQKDKETMRLFMNEVAAGDMADLIGQNQHTQQSSVYYDLARRSEPQVLKKNVAKNSDHLIPEKAPPELVLLVAKQSKLLRAGKDKDLNAFDQNKLLRSGNYWDGVWKEEVIPKSALRSAPQEKQLGSIKAKINPGTEFYNVVSRMKKISPMLLYIINKK